MNKLVSVIIPTFNSARYLAEAVRSVLDQSYADLEVIVVDDGSTDDTRQVVEGFKDARVRYAPMNERRGNYFARNHGLSLVKGEFVAFLDADDLWTPDKLEKQLRAFKADPSLGFCSTDHYVFFDDKKDELFASTAITYKPVMEERSGFLRELIRENFVITSSVLLRKECLDRVGLFDTAFQNAMDYDLWLRIVLEFPVRMLKERYVLRRLHEKNISRDKVRSWLAVDYLLRKTLEQRANLDRFEKEYAPVIREGLEDVRYFLGLEYLRVRDYAKAVECLRSCRPRGRGWRRQAALLAARLRLDVLSGWVDAYRDRSIAASLTRKGPA